MMIFDSHAHYDDESYDIDRNELLNRLYAEGVCRIINIGADLKGSYDSIKLSEEYPFIYASIGLHPQCAASFPENLSDLMEEMIKNEKVVAVGEIGLDYHYGEEAPKELQKILFEKQLKFAVERDIPVIIHDRDAHGDTMELLRKYKPKGVMHCFSGSAEMAKELVKMGMYIGFGGVLTFKNAVKTKEAAKEVPLEYILTETDAPYLAPTPFRGKRCDSSMIAYIIKELSEIKGISEEEISKAAAENASKLFGISL